MLNSHSFQSLLICFCCLFVSTSLISQSSYQQVSANQQCFESLIFESPNGEFIHVVDGYDTSSFVLHITVTRYTSSLQHISTLELIRPQSFRLHAAEVTSQNGVVLSGTASQILSDIDSVFVINVNSSNQVVWSKGFQTDLEQHVVRDIYETSDGGFIISGNADSSLVFMSRIFVHKLDQNGAYVWSKNIRSLLNGAFTDVGGVQENSAGDIIVFGTTRFNSEGSWIARLNGATGQLQTSGIYKTHAIVSDQPRPRAFFQRANGDLDLFYSVAGFFDNSMMVVVRVNASGQTLAVKRYYLTNSNLGASILNVQENGAGGYLIGGSVHSVTGFTPNALLLEIDAGLAVTNARHYGNQYNFVSFNVLSVSGGQYLIGGYADPNGTVISPSENGLIPWIARVNANPTVDCFHNFLSVTVRDTVIAIAPYSLDVYTSPASVNMNWSSGTYTLDIDTIVCTPTSIDEIVLEAVSVYPNPVSGKLTIENLNTSMPDISVVIYNISGQVVNPEVKLESSLNQISFNHPSGVYFVVLQTDKVRQTFRVVKE